MKPDSGVPLVVLVVLVGGRVQRSVSGSALRGGKVKKAHSGLTFCGCPAQVEEKQGDLRDNPNDSFSPRSHGEAAGCCRGARRLLAAGERRPTSHVQLRESERGLPKQAGGGEDGEREGEGERERRGREERGGRWIPLKDHLHYCFTKAVKGRLRCPGLPESFSSENPEELT